jgi:hypothetical protein
MLAKSPSTINSLTNFLHLTIPKFPESISSHVPDPEFPDGHLPTRDYTYIMKSKYRLNQTLELSGGFWPPGVPDAITTGTISSQRGRLHLLAAPTFNRLSDDELEKAFMSFGTFPEFEKIDALCGLTRTGKCTLLHLTAIDNRGVTDMPNRVQIDAVRRRVGVALMGLHVASAEDESLAGAAFYFTKINKWLPRAESSQFTNDGIIHISPFKSVQIFQFDSSSLRACVICEVFARNMKSVPRIRIIPEKSQSLEWFASIGSRLENFFTLFLGTSVSLKAVQLFQGKEDDGWLIQKRKRRREKVNYASWVRCKNAEIALALAKWIAVPEDERPVEKTVLGMVRKSSLFVETEFLALAQALEGFGRLRFEKGLITKAEFKSGMAKLRDALCALWGENSEITKRCFDALSSSNEASYGQRLERTYDMLSPDFALQLLGERSPFVRRVVQTRNYLTHLGISKGTLVVDDGKELFLLNRRLHAFLRCVMLIDLGMSENTLKEPILYQGTRWK